jgi:hypothetical protein
MIRPFRAGGARMAWFFMVTVLTTAAALPSTNGMALPIYPHTNHGGTAREPINEKYVNQAVINGDIASLYTTDSPQTVDAWYSQKLPKSCVRRAITETAIQYTCATRAVSILISEGQTHIILGPKP